MGGGRGSQYQGQARQRERADALDEVGDDADCNEVPREAIHGKEQHEEEHLGLSAHRQESARGCTGVREDRVGDGRTYID